MGRIALRKKHSDTTAVSNVFIDELMTDANEAQIKVYLYLLRCLEDDLPVTVTILADRFNYTEKDILRSLVYWERKGILNIEYNSDQNLVGICLCDCKRTHTAEEPLEEPAARISTATASAAAPVDPVASAKPFYSMEQMNDFRTKSEIQQLIYMTQQYMGKPLSVSDTNSLLYMYEGLHFPVELMEYVIEYCINGGHRSMRYIEKVAMSWAEQGITTVEEAKALGSNSRYRKECYMILKSFGITERTVVDSDIAFATRWIDEYGFNMDIILEACRHTLSAISKPSFNYADTILRRWHEEGVRTISDIASADERFKKSQSQSGARRDKKSTTGFSNFTERDVDYNSVAASIMENQTPLSKTQ